MTLESWSRGLVGSVVGGIYGGVLLLLAIPLMAGGHGTYLPLAVFGAPLSLFVDNWIGFLAVPSLWVVVGFALGVSRGSLIPVLVLVSHLLGVGAVLVWGSRYEVCEEQWQYFERAKLPFAIGLHAALLTYSLGQVAAWGLVAARWLLRNRLSQSAG